MNRDQFNRLLWQIGQVSGLAEFEIVGSNTIHAHLSEAEVSGILAVSPDIGAVIVGAKGWTEVLLLLGSGSLWAKEEQTHVDPVGEETIRFPAGWRDRRIRIRPPFPAAPLVLVPDLIDVVAAKMAAFRPQDLEFAGALLDRALVDPLRLVERIGTVERTPKARLSRAVRWVEDRETVDRRG